MSRWECPVSCSERALRARDEPKFESLHSIKDVDALGLDELTKEVNIGKKVNPGGPT